MLELDFLAISIKSSKLQAASKGDSVFSDFGTLSNSFAQAHMPWLQQREASDVDARPRGVGGRSREGKWPCWYRATLVWKPLLTHPLQWPLGTATNYHHYYGDNFLAHLWIFSFQCLFLFDN